LLVEPPKSVLQDIKDNNTFYGEETKNILMCPGYVNYFKNMFVVKAHSSFELTYNVSGEEVDIRIDKDQRYFDDNLHIEHYSPEQQMVHLSWFRYFFSESSVEISTMPAFFHHNNLNNHYVVAGKFDISKWFRPLYPNIILGEGKLKIKKGDALFYIKFDTDEKINFKHFKHTQEINDMSEQCLGLKHLVANMGFKRLYSLFAKRNFNKKVMKEIKKNLTGDFE